MESCIDVLNLAIAHNNDRSVLFALPQDVRSMFSRFAASYIKSEVTE